MQLEIKINFFKFFRYVILKIDKLQRRRKENLIVGSKKTKKWKAKTHAFFGLWGDPYEIINTKLLLNP